MQKTSHARDISDSYLEFTFSLPLSKHFLAITESELSFEICSQKYTRVFFLNSNFFNAKALQPPCSDWLDLDSSYFTFLLSR